MSVILYEQENKSIAVITPAADATNINEIAFEVVPDGADWWVTSIEALAQIEDFDESEFDKQLMPPIGTPIENISVFLKKNKTKKDEKSKKFVKRISNEYMDEVAKEKEYESILDLCSFISSSDSEIIAEAQAGIDFRDSVKSTYKQINKDIKDETLDVPTETELIAGLPTILWPV
jgi:hypothetical protein